VSDALRQPCFDEGHVVAERYEILEAVGQGTTGTVYRARDLWCDTDQEIVALKDDDERAYRMLVDLNYNLTNQVDAIRYLDKLLGIYARKKKFSKIVQLLEELVKLYPNDTGLRSRLAQMYRQMKRKSDAIDQLDVLGELQLEAGMQEDARKTIQQIIKLGPDNVSDYKRLLSQLGG